MDQIEEHTHSLHASIATSAEQAKRMRALFIEVVLAALDDAIAEDRCFRNGVDQIARWARSHDGQEVLSCAGIDPNERVVKALMNFVERGERSATAISKKKE